MAYTTVDDVLLLLQADAGKFKVGEAELTPGTTDYIAKPTIEAQILKIDAKINLKLEAKGVTASSYLTVLSYAAERYVAYEIYKIVYPSIGVNELPKAVRDWKEDADEIFEDLEKAKNRPAGALGNWENL
jgi:hypothetical protein